MKTSTRCRSVKLRPFRYVKALLFPLIAIFSIAISTKLNAQGSCTGLFTLTATRTYDAGANTTTFQFVITKTGAQNSLSHWSFPVQLCPGTTGTIADLLATATKETSTNGTTWVPVSTEYGVDPSTSDCNTQPVLKWNQAMNETTRYFRLVFPGEVNFTIPFAILKFGNACCRFDNVLTAAATVTCPADKTIGSCLTQTAVNAAFADWLDDVVFANGTISTNPENPQAPDACGGSVTVTWTVTGCGTPATCSATFTVTDAPAVTLTCPADLTVSAGLTQEQINTAFTNWLNSVQSGGGCNRVVTNGNPTAPDACGGSVTVTWTVTSDCEDDKTCSATFTVPAAGGVQLTCPYDKTISSCSQSEINTAFYNWLSYVSYSGGTLIRYPALPTAPSKCGGYIIVKWKVIGACETKYCSAKFKVNGPPAVTLTCPQNVTLPAGQTSEQIATAYQQWLASATASGGCYVQVTNNSTGVPTCGQTVTVTWIATSKCEANKTCSATFTVPPCEVFTGCTPGYWKNHPEAWGCGFTPYTKFFDLFVVINKRGLSPYLKLGQAVELGGGQFNALARHAVAALLNACHNNVNYPYTMEEIRTAVSQMFNTNGTVTLGGKTYTGWESLKNELDRANNQNCPLNNSNSQPVTSSRPNPISEKLTGKFTELTVAAYPNPFTDVVKFTIESDVTGKAQLEVVNILGQRVDIVYTGPVQADKALIVDYQVPAKLQETLIYILNVGGKKVTGKLLRVRK